MDLQRRHEPGLGVRRVGSYTSSSDASYELANLNSGLVIDVSGNSTNGGANQKWTLS